MNVIDVLLERHTAYRLTLSGLGVLAAISIVEGFLGWLPYSAIDLILSLLLLLFATGTTNALGSLFTKSAPAPESAFITALILFFVLSPLQSAADALVFLLVGVIAMLSKYVLAWRKVHIFNPAAFAVLVASLAGTGLAVWWVATPLLLPFVLVIGLLIVRKCRRFELFLTFGAVVLVLFAARTAFADTLTLPTIIQFLTTTPLLFFALFMLIDPHTSPLTKRNRSWYGILVGVLSSTSFAFGPLVSSPELALLVGNVYTFITTRRRRYQLLLQDVQQLSKEVYEFKLLPNSDIFFKSGQYMEWTLPHASPDNRGTRRDFFITSAPNEHFITFAATIPVESSTFKEALFSVRDTKKRGSQVKEVKMHASNVAGNFTLPKDPNKKILMVVEGIGIAPCMSMFRHLAIQHERRDMVLIYSVRTPLDFIYQKEIDELKESIGLRVIYLPIDFPELSNWEGESGIVTTAYVRKGVRDYNERCWFISGRPEQATEFQLIAKELGIPHTSIKFQLC